MLRGVETIVFKTFSAPYYGYGTSEISEILISQEIEYFHCRSPSIKSARPALRAGVILADIRIIPVRRFWEAIDALRAALGRVYETCIVFCSVDIERCTTCTI